MSKLVQMKKNMTRYGLMSLAVLAGMGAVCYGAYYFSYSKEEERRNLESALRQEQAKLAQLEEKFDIYESLFSSYMEIYTRFQKGRYALDIDRGRRVLEALRRKHRLTNLTVNMSAVEPYVESGTQYVGFTPVFREVSLRFSTLTDLHVYAFLGNIEKYLSGYIRLVDVKITRKRPFSDEILLEISRGATPEVVDADVIFLWLGIEEQQKDETANGGV